MSTISRPQQAEERSPADLLSDILAQCYGTCHWYQHWSGRLKYTDGIKTMAEHAGAYWLIDAIASYQGPDLDRKGDGSQFWVLAPHPEKGPRAAVLFCYDDIPGRQLVRQEIEFTDFPLDQADRHRWKFYVEGVGHDRVLLLPSEH